MFDFGFSELLLIALVTLIVVGPQRMPKVARTAGLLLGRLQRYISDIKSDIQREIQVDELKELQKQVEDESRAFQESIQKAGNTLQSEAHDLEENFAALERATVQSKKAADVDAVFADDPPAESATNVTEAPPAGGDHTVAVAEREDSFVPPVAPPDARVETSSEPLNTGR